MLLPDKHIRISESILGLSTFVLEALATPAPFDKLVRSLTPKFETHDWPAYHDATTVTLALCLLYSMGLIKVSTDGTLSRCD